MTIKTPKTKSERGTQATTAPVPTGAAAPTDPPRQVDPAVEAALAGVEPATGYALTRLLLSEQREQDLGFPPDTVALLDAAMLRIITLHSSDDAFARDYPEGTVVFASLEGIAPLLNTHLFLLPLERVQGRLPASGVDGESADPMGFASAGESG